MIFEGDSLKDYKLDFKNDKLVKVELPSVEERKVGKWINDAKLTVDTIAELQAENERLKRLSKGWLEEKKTLSDKLNKIEQIVNEWNNDASNSFGNMCKINGILKE